MPEPFLKWPGGKRWLVQRYSHLFPAAFDRYIEPFLGGGAIFFHLGPKKAILSDRNEQLVCAYRTVKDYAADIDAKLRDLHRRHSKDLYYKIRASSPRSEVDRAVRFLYLNRTCFNGIYRVNRRGEFNVPMGSKTLVAYDEGYLQQVSSALQHARLMVSDFETTIALAGPGDFLYVDPPYTVMHNTNNFVKYNDVLFSWKDQERLADAVRLAAKRGAMILVSNADHASVRALYRGVGDLLQVSRLSRLAAEPGARCTTTELVVTNY